MLYMYIYAGHFVLRCTCNSNYTKNFGTFNANTLSHRPISNATFTASSSFNMDSSGKDTAEEKRQSKLDDEEKHWECRDREMAK